MEKENENIEEQNIPTVEAPTEATVETTTAYTMRDEQEQPVVKAPIVNKKKDNHYGRFIVGGILFGVIAAVCFFGLMFVANVIVPGVVGGNKDEIDSTPLTTVSGGAVSSSDDVSPIVSNVMPSVVAITQNYTQKSYSIYGYYEAPATGSGSGFIVSQDDKELLIVTNNHVVKNAEKITVQYIDGETTSATIKGTDSTADLAVISVDMSKLKDSTRKKIKVAVLGDSTNVKVGQKAVAIGNALGYGQSVTVGYISAKDRAVKVTDEETNKQNVMNLLQTDAAINPGNSGGALLDLNGKVIGINSVKYAADAVEGMGYAIPISKAIPIINELMKREVLKESEKGYLGISGKTVSDSEHETYGIPLGAVVVEVAKNSAAEAAGVKEGDIITKINDMEVKSVTEVVEKVNSYRVGTEITLTIARKGNGDYKETKIKCKLKDASTVKDLDTNQSSSGSNSDDSNGNYGGGNNDGDSDNNNGGNNGGSYSLPWGDMY